MILFNLPQFAFAAIPNQQTLSDKIIRGGRPSNADLDLLKSQGYKTIINFENDQAAIDAEKAYAAKLGFKFLSYPMNAWSVPDDAQVNEVLKAMNDLKNFPMFIHCQHGRDRTGMVSAIYRVLNQRWTQAAAHDEMLALGFRKIFTGMDNYFWQKTK